MSTRNGIMQLNCSCTSTYTYLEETSFAVDDIKDNFGG